MSSFFDDFVNDQEDAPAPPPDEMTGAILAVDVGRVHTRAILLDQAEGMYRLFGHGEAPTTTGEPWRNLLYGVQWAAEQISRATERPLLDENLQIIMPERSNYSGVDAFLATVSGGKPIQAVVVGLMPRISIGSVLRAAESAYVDVTEVFSLTDHHTLEDVLNRLLNDPPDVVMITGGTNGGAVNAMRKRINIVALACAAIDRSVRPMVLYAGNEELVEEVQETFEEIGVALRVAANPRPNLHEETLDGIGAEMVALFQTQKNRSTGGFEEIVDFSGGGTFPTAQGFGQMIELLGYVEEETVLGIDVGSGGTTIAAYIDNDLHLQVYGDLGVGHAARQTVEQIGVEAIARWLTEEIDDTELVRDYLWNRWLHPHLLPAVPIERDILYAACREIIRASMRTFREQLPGRTLPDFDRVLLSGATLARSPYSGLGLLTLLDGVSLNNMTRVMVDPYALAPMLGIVLAVSPRAVVQALDTGVFINLATVFTTSGPGASLVIDREDGDQMTLEVESGEIQTVPLTFGADADVSFKAARTRAAYQVEGGQLGIVVDARQKPLRLPRSEVARRERLAKWALSIQEGS